jgi:curved DNA-binding protein CbpA
LVKDYYQLLGLRPEASPDEIKVAFRQHIARYHPDKVQHLGTEFQKLAQTRAAELTEAYNTLADARRRREYDRLLQDTQSENVDLTQPSFSPQAAPSPVDDEVRPAEVHRVAPPGEELRQAERRTPKADESPRGPRLFEQEQASRDELVRWASLLRLREAFREEFGEFETPSAPGFDVSLLARAGLLARLRSRPWILGSYVPRLDAERIREVAAASARLEGHDGATRWVFVLTSQFARPTELADAITMVRRKLQARRAIDVVMVPVDVCTWQALLPKDAPPAAKGLVARLRG